MTHILSPASDWKGIPYRAHACRTPTFGRAELEEWLEAAGGYGDSEALRTERVAEEARRKDLQRRKELGELTKEELAELHELEAKAARRRGGGKRKGRGRGGGVDDSADDDESDDEGEGSRRRGKKDKKGKKSKSRKGKGGGGKPSAAHREQRKAGQMQSKAAVTIQAKLRGKKQRIDDNNKCVMETQVAVLPCATGCCMLHAASAAPTAASASTAASAVAVAARQRSAALSSAQQRSAALSSAQLPPHTF